MRNNFTVFGVGVEVEIVKGVKLALPGLLPPGWDSVLLKETSLSLFNFSPVNKKG